MALRLRVQGAEQLKHVAEVLRGAPRKFHKELSVAFHDAGEDALYKVKGNVLSMKIRGVLKPGTKRRFHATTPGTNLRSDIADSIRLKIQTSGEDPQVTYTLEADQLGDRGNIPWHMESGGSKWRHPIMGNREAWASNVGQPFFYEELKADRDIFVQECEKAIDRIIEQLESE